MQRIHLERHGILMTLERTEYAMWRPARVMLLGSFLIAGCLPMDVPNTPFEPEVRNNTDDFGFEVASFAQNVTVSYEFTWQSTGTQADVNQSNVLLGGTA